MPNRQHIEDEDKPAPSESASEDTVSPEKNLKRSGSPHNATAAALEEGAGEDRIEVTYTTKSGETVTTFKPLAPAPSVHLSEMPDRPVTGITVVGYTHSGKRHVANIVENKGCRVRFLVEDDSDLCAQAKALLETSGCYGFEIVGFKDLQRAISSPQIDLVIVSSSNDRKGQAVSDALRAQKTVLCDKPVGLVEEEVKQLFALSRKSGKPLLTVLPGRPGFTFKSVTLAMLSSASKLTIRRLTKEDAAAAAAGRPPPARKPLAQASDAELQEMFVDVAMQDVFAVNFCMCMRPTEAVARQLPDDAGTAEVLLAYPNQTSVRVLCALGQLADDAQQFTAWGPRLAEMQRIDHMKRVDMYDVGGPAEDSKDSLRFTQTYDDSYKDALEQTYAAASGHRRFASRARPQLMEQNVLDCLRIAAAAARSLRAGGAPTPIQYTA